MTPASRQQTARERAEAFADNMIHSRGVPHRNDLVDAYLAGERGRQREIMQLLNAYATELYRDLCEAEADAIIAFVARLAEAARLESKETP